MSDDPAVLSDEQALAVIIRVADNLKCKAADLKRSLGLGYNQWARLRAAAIAYSDAKARLTAAEGEAGCDFQTLTDRRLALQNELAETEQSHAAQVQAVREWKARLKPKSKTD